jgi:translocator assembly and maintenance protein 41
MLTTTTARPSLPRLRLLRLSPLLIHRTSITESVTSTEDPSLPPSPASKPRKRLFPRPRPIPGSQQRPPFPVLPPSFGKNQILPVSSSKRALLESIVSQFQAPIRHAFAYGSGVFEQDEYADDERMLDFVFAVTHPGHWHSINMTQHPGHYPFHARLLGSSFVASVQDVQPGIWFNAFVPMKGVVSSSVL